MPPTPPPTKRRRVSPRSIANLRRGESRGPGYGVRVGYALTVLLLTHPRPMSVSRVARKLGLSPVSVRRYLEALADAGLVTREMREGHGTVYGIADSERERIRAALALRPPGGTP